MDFLQLNNNFRSVLDGFTDIVGEAIIENEAELLDLNISQLEQGKASDGLNIEPPYALEEYAVFKKSIGSKSPKGTPDLKLTGDFYGGFEISRILPEYIRITSSDEKTGDLEAKYSSAIFGLTDKNKAVFAQDYLKESLQNKIHERLTKNN